MAQRADASRPGLRAAAALALLLSLPLLLLIGDGRDFLNYAEFFDAVRSGGWEAAAEQRFEPAFAFAALLTARLTASDVLAFALLMGAGLALKLHVLARSSASRGIWALLVLFYVARFVPLHELTQLRISLALALAMLAAVQRSGPLFWGALAGSVLTHYSAILLVPLLLLWRLLDRAQAAYERHEALLWLAAVGATVLAGLLVQQFLEPLGVAFAVLDFYSTVGFGEDRVNLLSMSVLLDVLLLATALPLTVGRARLRFWWWVQVMALALFFALADFPVLAHRTREMLNVFWVFYLAVALQSRASARTHALAAIAATVPVYLYLHFLGSNALFPF